MLFISLFNFQFENVVQCQQVQFIKHQGMSCTSTYSYNTRSVLI